MDNKMSKYRIVTIIFGTVSVLFFFFLPFYHSTVVAALDLVAGLMGSSTGLGNISAFKFMMMAFQGSNDLAQMGLEAEPMIGIGILLLLPTLSAIMLVVFGIIGKKPGGIGIVICSAIMLAMYVTAMICVGRYNIIDYGISIVFYLIFVPAIITLIMGILEIQYASKQAGYTSAPQFIDQFTGENTLYDGADRFGRVSGSLEGIKGEYAGASLPIADGTRVTIGRSASDCNLIISNPAVSRVHCYVTYYADKDIYGVMDVSKFGVYDTRGNQIAKNQIVYMAAGDEIHIGKSHNVFRLS